MRIKIAGDGRVADLILLAFRFFRHPKHGTENTRRREKLGHKIHPVAEVCRRLGTAVDVLPEVVRKGVKPQY